MIGLESERFPLRNRLLAVPELKQRYLQYVKMIAESNLAWEHLGPKVRQIRSLIESEVAADTRKLSTLKSFEDATDDSSKPASRSLKEFSEKRTEFLLNLKEINTLPPLDESNTRNE